MSNTIFHGVAILPKRFTDYQKLGIADQENLDYQLFKEIQERYEDEILARPCVDTWAFGCASNDRGENPEYVIKILTTKPLEEINPLELEQLQEPVGVYRVELEHNKGMPTQQLF